MLPTVEEEVLSKHEKVKVRLATNLTKVFQVEADFRRTKGKKTCAYLQGHEYFEEVLTVAVRQRRCGGAGARWLRRVGRRACRGKGVRAGVTKNNLVSHWAIQTRGGGRHSTPHGLLNPQAV